MEPNTIILDQFRIERPLAVGGMAQIFVAQHLQTGTPVVVKVLKASLEHDSMMQKRFLKEVQNSRLLVHENIVKVFGGGEFRGETFMVMEFMDAGPLANTLRKVERLPWPLATWLMICVLDGLAYSHQQKLIHRDMKPDNLLLNLRGEIKITDFGISKALEGTVMTQEGEILGTPAYMAPEQITGSPVSEMTDLFSCGVIYLEMLTGVNPFLGNGINETVSRIISFVNPPLDAIDPIVPDSVRVAVSRMLQKNPRERFATVGESRDRLSYILERNGFRLTQEHVRQFLTNPAISKIDLNRNIAAAYFNQVAQDGKNLTVRNVKEAYDFAVRILPTFLYDPCHPSAPGYLRDFLKSWNVELPRKVNREMIKLEEECRATGLERAQFEQLLDQHQKNNNVLEVIYFLGALAASNPAEEAIQERIRRTVEMFRAALEYRLLGGAGAELSAAPPPPIAMTAPPEAFVSPTAAVSRANYTVHSPAPTPQPMRPIPPGAPSAATQTPTRPQYARPVAPRLRPVRSDQASGGTRGLFSGFLLIVLAIYAGVSYYLEASPVHYVMAKMNKRATPTPLNEYQIQLLPDSGLSYYQDIIRRSTQSEDVKGAYEHTLELLKKDSDWVNLARYQQQYDSLFSSPKDSKKP